MYRYLSIIILIASLSGIGASAQKWALKSNLLYDATATINAGAEVALAPRWSLDVSANLNAWTFSEGKRWKHWLVQPEARYWICDRFAGHFFGAHLLGGQYNIGNIDLPDFLGNNFSNLKKYRYQGWFVGAGLAYGYTWILSRHWSAEAEIGFGWAYTRYDKYRCANCGRKVADNLPHHYVGPTKAALNIVYVF